MAQNIKHLFKISNPLHQNIFQGDKSDTAAPQLQQLHGNEKTPQLIDVVNGFEWTHTSPAGRKEVPYIRLSEYNVEFSALLQNIRYMMQLNVDAMEGLMDATQMTAVAAGVTTKLNEWTKEKSGPKKTIANGLLKANSKASKLVDQIGNIVTIDGGNEIANHLKPYYGLYGTTPTGFEYTFPYFEQQWKEVSPRWNEYKGGGGLLSSFVNELFSQEGLGKEILEMTKFAPGVKGTYIERPYEYQYGQDLPTWTFSFNLLNTRDWSDVAKNWQLCYMLSYQNLPNKITKTMVDPPVIYEVEVPGLFYSPYAYLSRISITNKGAMRLAKVPLLKNSSLDEKFKLADNDTGTVEMSREGWKKLKEQLLPEKSLKDAGQIQEAMGAGVISGKPVQAPGSTEIHIETLVPDAYEVQITVQSLIPDSKNLYHHAIMGPSARQTGIYNVSMTDPDEFVTDKTKRKLQ